MHGIKNERNKKKKKKKKEKKKKTYTKTPLIYGLSSWSLDSVVECESYVPRHDKTCPGEFSTRPDTNQPVQPQKLARVLKFRV